MNKEHTYKTTIKWMGNQGQGTVDYHGYGREYMITAENKADILGSSDPSFRGDRTRYNPEDLLVASLSSCHMLCYLHLCSEAGVIITQYMDQVTGIMTETENGGGKFKEMTLKPVVTVKNRTMLEKAKALHHQAHELCFIANSVNFPVFHHPTIHSIG